MKCLKANSEKVQTPKGIFFYCGDVGWHLGYYNGNYKGVEMKVLCTGQTIKRLDFIMIFQGHIQHQWHTP